MQHRGASAKPSAPMGSQACLAVQLSQARKGQQLGTLQMSTPVRGKEAQQRRTAASDLNSEAQEAEQKQMNPYAGSEARSHPVMNSDVMPGHLHPVSHPLGVRDIFNSRDGQACCVGAVNKSVI